METKKKKGLSGFKMPHTYVILVTIMVVMLLLTHIIPAGEYDRVQDPVSGKMVVVPGSSTPSTWTPPASLICSWRCRPAMWMRPTSCS